MMAWIPFVTRKTRLALSLGTTIVALWAMPIPSVDAGVIDSVVELRVTAGAGVNVDRNRSIIPAGGDRSLTASASGAFSEANTAGRAILSGQTGGTVGIFGQFRKDAGPFSGGFLSVGGGLNQVFEIDQATTLFVEQINEAALVGDILSPFGPRWGLNFTTRSSSLNSSETWNVNLQPGRYELSLVSSDNGSTVTENTVASGTYATLFNWSIGSAPGTLGNPILPTEIAPGDFGFDVIATDAVRFYDPVFATGYDYVTNDVPFASVLIPDVLPGGDSQFELLVGSSTFDLQAGQEFDFTSIATGGVREFGIRGIDLTEQLDPNDPTAFITGLSFTQDSVLSSFRMTAVTANSNVVPEPNSVIAWTMLVAIGSLRRRRNRRSGDKNGTTVNTQP